MSDEYCHCSGRCPSCGRMIKDLAETTELERAIARVQEIRMENHRLDKTHRNWLVRNVRFVPENTLRDMAANIDVCSGVEMLLVKVLLAMYESRDDHG